MWCDLSTVALDAFLTPLVFYELMEFIGSDNYHLLPEHSFPLHETHIPCGQNEQPKNSLFVFFHCSVTYSSSLVLSQTMWILFPPDLSHDLHSLPFSLL